MITGFLDINQVGNTHNCMYKPYVCMCFVLNYRGYMITSKESYLMLPVVSLFYRLKKEKSLLK